MSEDINATPTSTTDDKMTSVNSGNDTPTPANDGGETTAQHMIPQSRLNEEITKRKGLESKIAQFEKSQAKAIEDDKVQRGEHETVITEQRQKIESLSAKAELYDSEQLRQKDELLSQLPEDKREQYSNYENGVLREMVSLQNANETPTPTPPSTSNAPSMRGSELPPNSDWTSMTPEERRKNWDTITDSATN